MDPRHKETNTMRHPRAGRWHSLVRLGGGLLIGLIGPGAGVSWSAEPAPAAAAAAAEAEVRSLTLEEALQIASERQPALRSARASLAAAEANLHGLEKLPAIPLTQGGRELPIRRKQAALGVSIAFAALTQAEHETVYDVKRTYYSVLYARAQKKVADDVVASLNNVHLVVKPVVEKEGRDFTRQQLDKITVYLRLAEGRQSDAARGESSALAALREAIGLGPECCIAVPDQPLPTAEIEVCLKQIVDLALARRGELVQTGLAADVFHLEVDAQGKSCLPGSIPTFASGGDIHARQVPQGSRGADYKPAGVALEMPAFLVGHKCSRQQRARELAERAGAVAEKSRNLVVLEAEDTFFKFVEAQRKVKQTREAAESGTRLSKETQEDWREKKAKVEDVLTNEVVAAQGRAAHNEAIFNYLIELAALERVTAGGFRASAPACLQHP